MKQLSNILSPKSENEIIDFVRTKIGQKISVYGLHFLLNKFDIGKTHHLFRKFKKVWV